MSHPSEDPGLNEIFAYFQFQILLYLDENPHILDKYGQCSYTVNIYDAKPMSMTLSNHIWQNIICNKLRIKSKYNYHTWEGKPSNSC